jgi:hypothetical protein
MNQHDIANAQDPDLRASLTAMQRAALLARQIAIQTGTSIVIVQDGQLVHVSAEELSAKQSPTNKTSLRGSLKAHANPELMTQAQDAWQAADGKK